jgi:hypothetical protein
MAVIQPPLVRDSQILAVVAITAMALTIGKPESLGHLSNFLEKLLKAIGRFLW